MSHSEDASRAHHEKRQASIFEDESYAKRITEVVARQALEVVNGYRPSSSLNKVLMPEAKDRLELRARRVATYRDQKQIKVAPRIAVGGINICLVNSKVIEANTVVRDSIRPRFVCMRWELKRSGWRITFLELG